MDTYQIEWKPSAVRELKRLDRQVVPRIVEAVETLPKNPYPRGIRKLHGSEHTYRMRVGDYRIVYKVFESTRTIHIARIRHRGGAYRT